jgi:osmotically-inducible protein OsmY
MRTLREEAIAQLVLSRLSRDLRTSGQTIDVSIQDGELLLLGSCDSQAQRAAARMIALGTHGVRRVTDRLLVREIAQSI